MSRQVDITTDKCIESVETNQIGISQICADQTQIKSILHQIQTDLKMKKKSNADETKTEFETELIKKEDELKAALSKITELTKRNSTLTLELEKVKSENIKKDEKLVEERNKISELRKNLDIKDDKVKILEGKQNFAIYKENRNDINRNSRRRYRSHISEPYPSPYSENSVYLLKY